MRQLRTILLALALAVAIGMVAAEVAEAGTLKSTIRSAGDLLNLTWE